MPRQEELVAALTRFKAHFSTAVPGRSLREMSSAALIAAVDQAIAANEIPAELKGEQTDLVQ